MQRFDVGGLPPEDRKLVGKLYRRMGAGYGAVLLVGCLSVLFKNPHSPVEGRQARTASGLLSAVASEAPNRTLCAERDLKLITLLNEHGEAQDVPADDLRNTFFALVKARKECASGQVQEALAIYDHVTFGSNRTASK